MKIASTVSGFEPTMALMPVRLSRLPEPQGVKLPPIRGSIPSTTVASRDSPPTRNWSRYKKLLIDNPKDANLLHRQKLWNFQKLNRGAFRSQISSLPDIPYRVHTTSVEKTSVGIQVDFAHRFANSLRVVFPTYSFNRVTRNFFIDTSDESGPTRDKACSPMHFDDLDVYEDDFDSDSSIEDPGFEFDSVIRRRNAGTMTEGKKDGTKYLKRKERKKKRTRDRHASSERKSILAQSGRASNSIGKEKSVTFLAENESSTPEITQEEIENEQQSSENRSTPDVQEVIEKAADSPKRDKSARVPLARMPTSESFYSQGSYAHVDIENIGHSSHLTLDPLSVIDFLSGSRTDKSRHSEIKPKVQYSLDLSKDNKKGRGKHAKDPEADRVWFQQIVGDKDIVDLGSYENFARTRPNMQETQSDTNNDRYTDLGRSAWKKGSITPRINSEPSSKTPNSAMKFSPYLAKTGGQSSLSKNRNPKRVMTSGKPS